jgi:hypothetical protein
LNGCQAACFIRYVMFLHRTLRVRGGMALAVP